MARLSPKWQAAAQQLQAQGDGVFTVVIQQGEVRQVAKRSKDVDNSVRSGVSSSHDGPGPGMTSGLTIIKP